MDNSNRSKFPRFWFPVILYSGIIFCASSVPNVTTPLPETRFDVILHIILYIPFGFVLARAVYNTKISISKGTLFWTVLLVSFLYGGSDEIHQSFVPGRSADLIDMIADTIGGGVGGYIFLRYLRRIKGS